MDFGYALGVLHHVPNTQEDLTLVAVETRSSIFGILVLHFDNRPNWYKNLAFYSWADI